MLLALRSLIDKTGYAVGTLSTVSVSAPVGSAGRSLRFGAQAHPSGGLRFGRQDYTPIAASTGAGSTATASAPAGSATGAASAVSAGVTVTTSAPPGSAGVFGNATGTGVTATASAPAGLAYSPVIATGAGVTVTTSAPIGQSGLRFGSQAYPGSGLRFGRQRYQPITPLILATGTGVNVSAVAPIGIAVGYNIVTLVPPFDFSNGSILSPHLYDSTLGAPKSGDTFRWPNGIGVAIYPDGHGESTANNLTFTGFYNDGSGDVAVVITIDANAYAYGFVATGIASAPVGGAVGPSVATGAGPIATTVAPAGVVSGGARISAPAPAVTTVAPNGSVVGFTAAGGTVGTVQTFAPNGTATAFAIAAATGAGVSVSTAAPTASATGAAATAGTGFTATASAPAGAATANAFAAGAGVIATTFAPTGIVSVPASATGAGVAVTATAPAGTAATTVAASATGGGIVVASIVPVGSARGGANASDAGAPLAAVISFPPGGAATGGLARRFRTRRIDVTRLLTDPDFVSLDLVCQRSTQSIDNYGRAQNAMRLIEFSGVVTNDSGDKLTRGVDSGRIVGNICVHTRFPLSDGMGINQDADIVVWQGRNYVVSNVADWSHFGRGFVKATCDLLDMAG